MGILYILGKALAPLTLYLAVGLGFAPLFMWSGLKRIDPVAAKGSLGFRLLILPGVIWLWPALLRLWISGAGRPPEERNAHRKRAGQRQLQHRKSIESRMQTETTEAGKLDA